MTATDATFSATGRLALVATALLMSLAAAAGCPSPDEATFAEQREQMVRTQLAGSRGGLVEPVRNPRVLRVMGMVPRHRFVSPDVVRYAYADHPLPIGHGQTISQPYMVAKMTELVEPRPEHRVLEVGTGSGYQAAVLAHLVAEVYTIEIIEPLGLRAKELLAELGHSNVQVRIGDGYRGWPEAAPFDVIVVTAGAREIPPPLIAQLKPGGKIVIPVGASSASQTLMLVSKSKEPPFEVRTEEVMPVAFVPLVREPDRPEE